MADMIASATNFLLTNKDPKQEKFRQELNNIQFLRTCDCSIRPSSFDYLKEAMHSNYDESPLDITASLLCQEE